MKEQSKYYRRNWASIFLGGFGSQMMYVFMVNYSSFFFTNFLGISAGMAGTIFMLSRIWDGINDPMCGVLIEKSNPKHGKIQTWQFFGGLFTAVGLVMLFTVPGFSLTGRTIWGAVSYNVMGMAFTAVTVSTLLQMARGTHVAKERVSLSMAYTIACSIAGILLGVMIAKCLEIFGAVNPAKGYQMTAVISAIGGFVFLIGSVVLFRDQATEEAVKSGIKEENPKVKDMLKAVLKTPAFFIMVLAPSLMSLGSGIASSDMLYYLTYKIQKPELMAMLLPAMYIGTFAGSILAGYLFRFGKVRMMKIGFLCVIAGFALRMIAGDSGVTPFIGYGMYALGSGLVGTYLNPCLVDCADYAEYKTGVRCQAVTLTGYTLVQKMSGGLGMAFLGFALQSAGYDGTAATQSAEAVKMIHIMHFWPIMILCVISIILVSFYKLDEKTMEKVRAAKAEANS